MSAEYAVNTFTSQLQHNPQSNNRVSYVCAHRQAQMVRDTLVYSELG